MTLFTLPGFAAYMARAGLFPALALPVILAETIGGVALVQGVQGRIAAMALLPVPVGAWSVHAVNGWVFNAPNGGWEYPAFLTVAAVVVALAGDGALALLPTRLPRPAHTTVHA